MRNRIRGEIIFSGIKTSGWSHLKILTGERIKVFWRNDEDPSEQRMGDDYLKKMRDREENYTNQYQDAESD